MELSRYIDLNTLSDDARKELKNFYDYLLFKYHGMKKKKNKKNKSNKKFNAIRLDTRKFKFDREDANAR